MKLLSGLGDSLNAAVDRVEVVRGATGDLYGAGALGGIGFTMSLFIAGQAFPNSAEFAAAKIAIFIASLIAAVLGTIILYPRRDEESEAELITKGTEGQQAQTLT